MQRTKIAGLQTVEGARRRWSVGTVETAPPWPSPYETRTTYFPYQKRRRQSSGAWEKSEAPGMSQRMLACWGSSASRPEKSNPKSICQSPHCSDVHAGLQKRGGVTFLCRNQGRKKSARCHCVLYVTLTDVKRHVRTKEKSEHTCRNNGLRGLKFGGLSKPWLDDSHENVQSDCTLGL